MRCKNIYGLWVGISTVTRRNQPLLIPTSYQNLREIERKLRNNKSKLKKNEKEPDIINPNNIYPNFQKIGWSFFELAYDVFRTNGQSWAATRPASAFGYIGINISIPTAVVEKSLKKKCGAVDEARQLKWSLYVAPYFLCRRHKNKGAGLTLRCPLNSTFDAN